MASNRPHTTTLNPSVWHCLGSKTTSTLPLAELAPDQPPHEAKEGAHSIHVDVAGDEHAGLRRCDFSRPDIGLYLC